MTMPGSSRWRGATSTRLIKVPASYVERANALGSASYSAWRKARPSNDFASMRPYLEKSLELTREYVEFFAPYQDMADPLIDDVDEGLTCAAIRALFDQLRRELVPLVTASAISLPRTTAVCTGNLPNGRSSNSASRSRPTLAMTSSAGASIPRRIRSAPSSPMPMSESRRAPMQTS